MALDPEPNAEAAAGPPAEVLLPPNRGRLPSFARAGLFGGLFAAALLVSWQFRENAKPEEETAETSVEPPKVALKKIDSDGNAVESLARGDDALQRHLYAVALSHYEQLLSEDAGAAAIVEYRVGLCHEALAKSDRAIAAYRKAISTSTSQALTAACELAMARCLLQRNEPAQVRRLLYPLLLDEGRQHDVPKSFVLDARFLVALAWARQGLTPRTERLVDDNAISFAAVPLEISFYLDGVGPHAKPKVTTDVDKQPVPRVVRPCADKQPALIVAIDEGPDTAWTLVESLTKQAGLPLDCDPEAKQILSERSLRLSLRNWPVLDVLEQVADFFEMTCSEKDGVVKIQARAKADAKRLRAADQALTSRLLLDALAADANHNWAPAACLELGNLAAIEGKPTEATKRYEWIIREAQASPYVAAAYYNLARLQIGSMNPARARRAFFRVVDQSGGHELALRAQLRIGHLFLEEEDCGAAIVQLRRAQLLAPHSPYQPLATLTLAAAYLQQMSSDQTCLLLAGQRSLLQKEPYKAAAAFLDAYAQYRLAKMTASGRREASELLSALWRDQDNDSLGIVGQYLKAQAYRDLGFWDQAEKLLRASIKRASGPLNVALEYLLGETLQQQNHGDEAAQIFEKLAATPSAYRSRAGLQLAQIDLAAKKYEACALKCQALWLEHALPDGAALLQIWGAALEGTGDFPKAAQCFAGKAPL